MTHTSLLAELPLPEFANRLAARTPTPGGGSTAAYLVELGAALTAMACRFTTGEKFAGVEVGMAARVEQLELLRRGVRPLIDRDSAAYDAVTAAYKLPKATDAEKSARSAAIQAGLRGALEVPALTLGQALLVLRITAAAAPEVNPNLASDAATAVWCSRSAAEAAFLNVRINAGSLTDKTWAAERLGACERELAEVRALAEGALAALEKRLA